MKVMALAKVIVERSKAIEFFRGCELAIDWIERLENGFNGQAHLFREHIRSG